MSSFRIAQWTVHPADGTLANGERNGRLEPKVMGVLVYLATHPGRVISKKELLDAVWPETHVQEVALSRSVSEIRRQLGDDAREPTFIETVPKLGYRLMVPVEPMLPEQSQPLRQLQSPERLQLPGGAHPMEQSSGGGVTTLERAQGTALNLWEKRRALALIALLGALGIWLAALRSASSVAVVPFRNLGGDLEIDYFSAGVTEDITARLSQVRQLRVKPLARAFTSSNTPPSEAALLDLSRLGRSAKVDAVLDGSVRREGERIRVVARLVEVDSGEILWAHTYDRRLEGIFDIQQELANRIAVALEARLSPVERERLQETPTDQITAYDYFLRGRDKYQRYERQENEAAIDLYLRALELDPEFALAFAELASAYALRVGNYGVEEPEASLELAREALERALALAPDLPEAHKALGIVHSLEGYPRRALQAYGRALELRPDYREAENNVAFLRLQLGHWDEAGRWQPRSGTSRLE